MAGAISSYLTILVARRRKAQADASDRTDSNNDEAPADGSFAHSHLFSTSAIGSINGDYYSSLNACSTELVPSYSSSSYAAQVNVSCVRVALSTEVARASTTKVPGRCPVCEYSNNNVCNGGLDGENIQCGAGRSNCSDSSGRHISRDSSVSTRESGISSLSGASGEADVSDNYDNTNSIFSTFSPLDTSSIWTSGSDKSYMMLDADDADSDYEVVNKESVVLDLSYNDYTMYHLICHIMSRKSTARSHHLSLSQLLQLHRNDNLAMSMFAFKECILDFCRARGCTSVTFDTQPFLAINAQALSCVEQALAAYTHSRT
ncbi:hypothetical protein IW140_006071 [Coemansia sp. RSA 1813]|nr:hypothetical protein EV179_006034 [Coemansia sp. RSA 487]KAJ2563513.1 hypothetical protein IW140_006071 [Coemansia sp. RSA 1813]